MNQVNQSADEDEQTLRLSIDAKATVNIGEYDRGGKPAGSRGLLTMIFSRPAP